MTQKFKGDPIELQMEAAGKPPFDTTRASLVEYFSNCYNAADFILALYDNERAPFVDRVPRAAFVNFLRQALASFPFTGTFETYLFILNAVFGPGSQVQFTIPAAGKLNMLIDAVNAADYQWQAREFINDEYLDSEMVTSIGDAIQFYTLTGIQSEAQILALLAELIPAGIFPTIEFKVFRLYSFVASDGAGNLDTILTLSGDQIVFFELGA